MTVIDLTEARAHHDAVTQAFFAEPTEERLQFVLDSYREKRLVLGDDPALVTQALAVVAQTLRCAYGLEQPEQIL